MIEAGVARIDHFKRYGHGYVCKVILKKQCQYIKKYNRYCCFLSFIRNISQLKGNRNERGAHFQSLYESGDKEKSFVGSHQWIGSVELGYCLENMAGIASRLITTNSGTEVGENARKIAEHFQKEGSPIMIGSVLHSVV